MLAAPAQKSQLFSIYVVHEVDFGKLVGFGTAVNGWVSVGDRFGALQIYDSAMLVCDLMCVFMASGG